MNLLFVVFLLCCQNLAPGKGTTENFFARTLHGTEDPPPLGRRTLVLNADVTQNSVPEEHRLHKRAAPALANNDTIIQKMNYLNDSHKQLMVHWVGEGSNVIICLAKDPTPATGPVSLLPVGPSAVYISYNYGDTYENKTEQFKMPNGSYAVLDKFYNHPKYNTHFVFADIRYNMLYVTSNHGRDIKQIQLNFTPSDVSFHELQPAVFVVLDKTDPKHTLWITEDFGENFRPAQDFVKAFYWVKKDNEEHKLVVQRMEPNGLSSVIYSSTNLYTSRVSTVYSSDSKDFFIKGDYLFTTKTNSDGVLELYVSYKLGQLVKCEFDTRLEKKAYYIVDVTNNRALVAVSHTDTGSHLYVSENLEKGNRTVKFTLSLEDVLCYFPNSTWQATWLHHVSEEAFADVYKVEGLAGIYVASRVLVKPLGINLGPQHLGSVITFDHGRSWRLIRAPIVDVEYQQTACSVDNNCSLHLSQKFSQLYPDTRSISILSSKSAPGIIIATGVLGKSLKGHYGVYVSTDAGLTWRQTLRDLYFFNMGDHGGIFTAVKYFKLRGETRHVLYSTDEGETWKQSEFHNEDIRLYGLMTEPGENTTVFTMFGSLPQEHQWIIVKLDLIKAFKYNCSKDDYKPWSPGQSDENRSYIPCVLGQQLTFQRRLPHANCYNGQDFDAPISMRPCECDIYDYECDWRFVRSKDPGHCIPDPSLDFDPYKIPDECQPGNLYLRWKGYRRIPGDKCVDGFRNLYEPEHVPCPFNEVQDFLLFAQRERISRYNLVTKAVDELPVKKLKNVIAIDFDMKNNCVYWADIALDTIGRQCLSNGSEPEILVSSDLASIEGMALDWISNTLYFVDGMRSKIELIRTDINHSGRMRRTILGPDVLKKPRGIALHPKAGYMFWTDWSAENPSVNRANLDGSNILKLFGKPRVEWPNGITIDYVAERIYWVDARQDYIASSDLHGDFFKMIVAHEEVVSHPFAVAVFKNNMYWDDWKRNAIFGADKNQFRGVEVLLKQLPGLMDLKVYSHGIQIGTNACANTTWPYVCVGLPKTGARSALLCPDGMTKQNGKCLCPGNVEPYANSTCPKIDNSCSPEHFACGNGFCVPKGWRCDGEDDCGDNSDERQCGTQTCPPSHFVCGDGKCVPQYWRCDYDSDCPDGSDEMNCPKQNCTEDQFTCNNGRCVSLKWRCDRENDCRDGSDELNCTPMEPTACKKDEFQCKSGALTCIPPTWRCDGERDCRDGSDEADCTNNTCLNVQFSCGPPTNRCIYLTWVCDGTNDCPDGRDEKNCTTVPPPPPPVVPPTDNDNTDQFVQKNGTCQEWMFKCMNTKCIPYWWKCDGSDDCGDDSDEMGCHTVEPVTFRPQTASTPPSRAPPKQCQSNQFQCLIGGDCIFASWVCDGMEDCEAGEDELNCFHTINCTSAQFRCRMDGSCIPSSAVCDQHFDCPDGTDELECEHNLPNAPATPSCNVGYFPCDSNSCYPLAAMCDGKSDCRDGYDEANCTKARRVYQVLQMGVDERGINESTLLLYWWIPTPTNVTLEFMPTISKVDEEDPSHSVWHNQSWTENSDYLFTDLEPYTKYNMTIYVRVRGSNTVFPPAKYFIAYTGEGIPTEPWNVTAKQRNGSHVLITWNKPVRPNGVIAYYQICWYPPLPPIKLKLSGNETAHLLAADFQSDVNYSFYVIAHNRKFESRSSEPTTIKFDGDSGMDRVRNLTVLNRTDTSLVLGWKYNKTADGFTVYTLTDRPYPKLPPLTTKDTNITIDKLAPGAHYRFRVNAFKKTFVGPETTIGLFTDGLQLPEVSSLQGMAIKNIGTAVKLSWERPKDSRKVNWVYGVYYGIDEDELFEKPRLQTTNLTAIVTNLQACEIYTFTIGLVGPLGYGPLSKKSVEINTSLNKKAPPKKLTVTEDKSNSLKIKVQWQPSCPSEPGSVSYVIRAHERTRNKVWYVKKDNSTNLTHVFNVTYGAVYDISVATTDPEAIYTPNVTYFAPPILPPAHVKTFVENNGSFVVYWNERDMPKDVGRFKYEVLVSRGNELNESTAEKFVVDQPPFIYSNTTFDMYTFAVRVKAESGFMSPVSEKISATTSYYQESQSIPETSLSLILSLTVVGLIVAALVVVVLFVKHRRLQNSFTRFANSHYNTRSGAATFDDHSLEEEDNSPQITGFSDDEPLVIA